MKYSVLYIVIMAYNSHDGLGSPVLSDQFSGWMGWMQGGYGRAVDTVQCYHLISSSSSLEEMYVYICDQIGPWKCNNYDRPAADHQTDQQTDMRGHRKVTLPISDGSTLESEKQSE